MAWKTNGPGGCCCGECWYWEDDFADGTLLLPHPPPTNPPPTSDHTVYWITQQQQSYFQNLLFPEPHMRLEPEPAQYWQILQTLAVPNGWPGTDYNYNHIQYPGGNAFACGIYTARLKIEPGAAGVVFCYPSNSGGSLFGAPALVFDEPSGKIYFAHEQYNPVTRFWRHLVPETLGVAWDFSEVFDLQIHIGLTIPAPRFPFYPTQSITVFLNGTETMRASATYYAAADGVAGIRPGFGTSTIYAKYDPGFYGTIAVAWPLGYLVVDNFLTPANTQPPGVWRLYPIRYDVAAQTAPDTAGCNLVVDDFWENFDRNLPVVFLLSGSTAIDHNKQVPPSALREYDYFSESYPGGTVSFDGADYDVQLNAVRVRRFANTWLKVSPGFRYRLQTIPPPAWSYISGGEWIFDNSVTYTWPMAFTTANMIARTGTTGGAGLREAIYDQLVGNGWTFSMYHPP